MSTPELAKVFKDASTHKQVAGVIIRHLSNKQDIRSVALDGLDLSGAVNILDLGCGFGFFTEGLNERVGPEARVMGIDRHPEYEWFYFQASERAGVKARFRSNGSSMIREMESNSFDLILCSFALYFFPELIGEISRLLKKDGIFVTITHATPHMFEFINYMHEILEKHGFDVPGELPYEELINQFSDKNGKELLGPFFNDVSNIPYRGDLVFGADDFFDFVKYYNFKHTFFIPEELTSSQGFHRQILDSVEKDMINKGELRISKNDMIFICREPNKQEE